MKNLSIARRLQAMIACAIVTLIVLAASGANVAANLRGDVAYLYSNTLPSITAISEVNENFLRMRLLVLYHIALKEPEKKAALEPQMKAQKEKIQQGLARYEKELLSDAKDKSMLDIDKKFFSDYFGEVESVLEKSRPNDFEATWAAVAKVARGVERAQEANASMRQIGEIAEAIREQGTATNNIATQVERIAQMSEESSAAADMQRIVSTYRL